MSRDLRKCFYCCNQELSLNQFQELLVVHLFISNILPVTEQCVRSDGCRGILSIHPALDLNRAEYNSILLGSLFQNRNILCVKRALVGIVKNVTFLLYVRVLCAFFEYVFL